MANKMVAPASTWKEAEENLLSCTAQILNQAVDVLRSKAMRTRAYTHESKIMAGSTPGKHFRHVLDHVRILLDAIEAWQAHTRLPPSSSSSSGPSAAASTATRGDGSPALQVDYDARLASKVADIETSATASLREFESTISHLYRLFDGSDGRLYMQPLRLCATTPFAVEMDSTVGRELWFCGLHAIHHYALARVILVKELGLKLGGDEFGVAPSTLVHREWRKESNRADVARDALAQGKRAELPSTTRKGSSGGEPSSRAAQSGQNQQLKSKL